MTQYHKDFPHEPESYQEGHDRRTREEAVEIERRKEQKGIIDTAVKAELANHRTRCKSDCPAYVALQAKYDASIPKLEASIEKVEQSVIKIYEKMDKIVLWIASSAIVFILNILWQNVQKMMNHITP